MHIQSTSIQQPSFSPFQWVQNTKARCSSLLFSMPEIDLLAPWYSLRERFGTPIPLMRELRTLARDQNLSSHFDTPAQELICQAFSSSEYSYYSSHLATIFQNLSDEQLHTTLQTLFASQPPERSSRLITRLMRLLTLQKIESAISTDRINFPHFTNSLGAARTINTRVRHHYDNQEASKWQTFLRTAHFYFITILDKTVTTALSALNLDVYEDFSLDKDEGESDRYAAYTRYAAFQTLLEVASAAIVGLSLLLGSPILTAVVAAVAVVVGVATCLCYFKWFKPLPENIHPFKNLVTEAIKGHLAPVHGRKKEIDELIEVLCSNQSTMRLHPLLKGKTGVGKTEIISGLAQRIAAGNVPEELKGKKLFSVNAAELIKAGGGKDNPLDRFRKVFKGHESDVILFIDEVHTAFAKTSEGINPLGQKLKTYLDPGPNGLRYCITATTNGEYDKFLSDDDAFVRRIHIVDVKPLKAEKIKATLTEMMRREAPDITVKDEAIDTLIGMIEDPAFANGPQPFQAKAILSQAFTKVRTPSHLAPLKDELDQLRDRQEELECLHNISYGIDALPYTAAGQQHAAELQQINDRITALEAELQSSQTELHAFLELVKQRNALKTATDIAAMRIALSSDPSEQELKKYILQLHYLQVALHNAVEEHRSNLPPGTTTTVDKALIDELLDAKRTKIHAAEESRADMARLQEENSFQQELALERRKRAIQRALAAEEQASASPAA